VDYCSNVWLFMMLNALVWVEMTHTKYVYFELKIYSKMVIMESVKW